jgi:glutamyl-tRNA reductase
VSIVVIGLNHRTVPLGILERLTLDADRLPKALHDLSTRENITEVVVLSTCNRIEIYAVAERFHGAYADTRDFLSELGNLAPEEFGDHLYSHYDRAAVEHLFAVASGLDSAVLGESEILGQVRTSWEHAQSEGACGASLNMLFRHALEVGKRARTETAIGRHTASVSHAAIEMVTDALGTLEGRRVLVLGAGDMGEGLAMGLARAGVGSIEVANRTASRGAELADRVGGRAVALSDVAGTLTDVDVLLTSTGARSIMLEFADVAGAMAARPERPLLIVDVAVPRDVDPSVTAIAGVTLFDLDDLQGFAARGLAERQGEVAAVRDILEVEVARYLERATARSVAPLVGQLHEHAERVRAGELERLRSRLETLDDSQREAVEHLTRGIIAKLMHEPSVRLKDAAGTLRGERLADAARHLFDLS